MSKHKKQSPAFDSRIAGVVIGAIVAAVWTFLQCWKSSVRSFWALGGKAFALFGLLLGWLPALIAALLGLVYGAWKGGQLGLLEGFKTIVIDIDKLAAKFEMKAGDCSCVCPLEWRRIEMLLKPRRKSKPKPKPKQKARSSRM